MPEVHVPKDPVIEFAEALRFETNQAFIVLRDIASGRDLKKFLYVCCYFVFLNCYFAFESYTRMALRLFR